MLINLPTYTVRHNASETTAQVLIELRAASGIPLIPIKAWVTADVAEAVEQLRFALRIYGTQGSTGTALTEDPHQAGFGASQAVAVYNPGTDPTSLAFTIDNRGAAIAPGNGYEWERNPDESWIVNPTDSLVLELLDAPGASIALSFGLVYAEVRG